MDSDRFSLQQHVSLTVDKLLYVDEVVLIVDDDQAIREPLNMYLTKHGLAVIEAGSAAEMRNILNSRNVALILLDIGLPDSDGLEMLPEITNNYPGLSVVMLTGVADLHVAMECIRKGADDFLAKPAQFDEILFVIRKVLEKRRLVFENIRYQEDLVKANFRIKLLHQLSVKMNTAYLSTVDLDDILRAVLVGTTADEGLRFNRAFLALFDRQGKSLDGVMAIGSQCREEAGKVWAEMREREMGLLDIVHDLKESCHGQDQQINQLIRTLKVPATETDNILIQVTQKRQSVLVEHGLNESPTILDLMNLLGNDTFVIVPLYSPSSSLGVIIADNFVTRQPIQPDMISALELFASQASLAIEHSHLYADMQMKIVELEDLTNELDKNKDMLVEAERYAALGQMSAQLVHSIRNPITSIGGVARLLAKRVKDEEWLKFIDMMIKETARLESTLEDLFDFVSQVDLSKESAPLYPLVRKTIMLVQPTLIKQGITWELDLPDPDPVLAIDIRQMRQVFLHLVKNSIEAMPEGGEIIFSVRREEDWIHIRIADSGPGILDANLEKARDPFFTTKTYGTGLGLSLVEHTVQAHGGKFFLRRREEGGTEALISLPYQPA